MDILDGYRFDLVNFIKELSPYLDEYGFTVASSKISVSRRTGCLHHHVMLNVGASTMGIPFYYVDSCWRYGAVNLSSVSFNRYAMASYMLKDGEITA